MSRNALRQYITEFNYNGHATFSFNRPLSLAQAKHEFIRYMMRNDKGLYGKSLRNRNDRSNRDNKSLHPEAQTLWNSKERKRLEKNTKGHANGFIRHCFIERAEAPDKSNKEAKTIISNGGQCLHIDLDNYDSNSVVSKVNQRQKTEWKQEDIAWWHIHMLYITPKDTDHNFTDKSFRNWLERRWYEQQDITQKVSKDYTHAYDGKRVIPLKRKQIQKCKETELLYLTGNAMIKPINNEDYRLTLRDYTTKQQGNDVNIQGIESIYTRSDLYLSICSNRGNGSNKLQAARQALLATKQENQHYSGIV
jgi:hypothetical protein